MTIKSVAVLGTGLMGGPMAQNLLKAGFAVHVWNRSAGKARALAEHGAQVHGIAASAGAEAQLVITMLSDGSAVADVLFQKGVAAALKPGTIVCDMSSITPEAARQHAEWLAGMEIGHLDAPVSGGTRGAQDATLAIMAGGQEEVFTRAEPVLRAMGRPVLVGLSGAGQTAKLCNQAIVGITIGAVAEAMLLMEKGGGKPDKLREALAGGFADSIILQQHGKRMNENDFAPGAASRLQLKDLDNVGAEADKLGLDLPFCEASRKRYRRLVEELGGAELDHSALFLELLERNGSG